MALLYYHANLMNRLVVGTGDRTELLLGYFPKYGDGGVDVLPIADLYKTEVRRLGKALGINRRIVAKQSSPRLWLGQVAESEIGMSYETIDRLFKLRFEEGLEVPAIAAEMKQGKAKLDSILAMYEASEHKRRLPEICKLR